MFRSLPVDKNCLVVVASKILRCTAPHLGFLLPGIYILHILPSLSVSELMKRIGYLTWLCFLMWKKIFFSDGIKVPNQLTSNQSESLFWVGPDLIRWDLKRNSKSERNSASTHDGANAALRKGGPHGTVWLVASGCWEEPPLGSYQEYWWEHIPLAQENNFVKNLRNFGSRVFFLVDPPSEDTVDQDLDFQPWKTLSRWPVNPRLDS